MTEPAARPPLYIRMHDADNVAIVANDRRLAPGSIFSDGLTLVESVPQGHKVALVDLAKGAAVLRYNVAIGHALKDIPAGSWVHERPLEMPCARSLENLPIATVRPEPVPALEGYTSMIDSVMQAALLHLERLDARRRETVPASELVVGVQCGGSDAFSGVTANPGVGFASDLLVSAGATVMFSETTEVRDGIDQLTAQAISPEVARGTIREMAWYDAYLQKGRVDRSANTTPGNKKGGLSNIVEKAMGSIVKSGSAPISGVLAAGEKPRQKGLIYAATPASDFICGTLQLAAGMNLRVFTTGRGTPYGLAAVPVIKGATRTDLAQCWHDLMDVNAGRVADGDASIAEVGWELFHLMLEVASGRKKTWAEHWKLHKALVLFNPAPVT
jgi:galactarate dehydratase